MDTYYHIWSREDGNPTHVAFEDQRRAIGHLLKAKVPFHQARAAVELSRQEGGVTVFARGQIFTVENW